MAELELIDVQKHYKTVEAVAGVNLKVEEAVNPLTKKARKGRAVLPMSDAARAALSEAKAAAISNYVIEWNGERVKSIKKGFGEACRRAGLTDVTPHTIRHTVATHLDAEGVEHGGDRVNEPHGQQHKIHIHFEGTVGNWRTLAVFECHTLRMKLRNLAVTAGEFRGRDTPLPVAPLLMGMRCAQLHGPERPRG